MEGEVEGERFLWRDEGRAGEAIELSLCGATMIVTAVLGDWGGAVVETLASTRTTSGGNGGTCLPHRQHGHDDDIPFPMRGVDVKKEAEV